MKTYTVINQETANPLYTSTWTAIMTDIVTCFTFHALQKGGA